MPDAARLRALAERLQARAQQAPPPGLVPFLIADEPVGAAAPAVVAVVERITGFARRAGALDLDAGDSVAERSVPLAAAALALRAAGLLPGWRDELLAVRGSDGRVLAEIERAACRPLGITTDAVHLNASADDGALIVARRAAHKAIDPGLLDNLVGGMVPAGESLEQALAREAWEEAGLRLDQLRIQRGRRFHVQRPVPEGWQSERIHVYEATLPHDVSLANQDGEVQAITRMPLPDVLDAIERGEFTLEAALVTLEALLRRAEIVNAAPGLYA
jgi:8-oxo-dGTP pyrophosphatase MutT (NUDIX family)